VIFATIFMADNVNYEIFLKKIPFTHRPRNLETAVGATAIRRWIASYFHRPPHPNLDGPKSDPSCRCPLEMALQRVKERIPDKITT
jgi:hypothetical protein